MVAPGATSADITEADLRTRLAIYADDSMRGRRAGTPDNLRSTAYIEREVRRLGLQPAGDSGGYFQDVPLFHRGVTVAAHAEAGATPIALWTDLVPVDAGPGARAIGEAQTIYVGSIGDTASLVAPAGTAGKAVVLRVPAGLPFGYVVQTALRRYPDANAIVLAGVDRLIANYGSYFQSGNTFLAGSMEDVTTGPTLPAVLLATSRAGQQLLGASLDAVKPGATGAVLRGDVRFERTPAPARNVVAILPGSDPALRGEYVAIGAHSDHIGISRPVDHDSLRAFNQRLHELGATDPFTDIDPAKRATIHVNVDSLHRIRPARLDSINNGADDDGSGSMGVLELAERFANAPVKPKRSILFVWHTAEELGLFGSQWFTDHPTVPRDSIVAQLNMDMIGRGRAEDVQGGGPTYLQLVGSRRLSKELGDLVEAVNAKEPMPFTFDYSMDATGHPEQIYCRSDHASYARYGIPVTFFTTGQHADYHQVTDEPQYIDYPHYARVVRLVYDIALELGNRAGRPQLDAPKPDPRVACRQ